MRTLGSIMLTVGIMSAVLKLWFTGYYHALLYWVDQWGNPTGWAIRIGVIVIGAVLMWFGSRKKQSQQP